MTTHDKAPVILTSSNFEQEVLGSSEPVLVDFWAPWCAPCRAIAPSIEELAVEFAGLAKVAKLDVDATPEIAEKYGVRSIPTLLFFRDGEAVDRLVGGAPKKAIAAKLQALLSIA